MQHLERALDGQNQWWKYLVMLLASLIGGSIIGAIPLIAVGGSKALEGDSVTAASVTNFGANGISENMGLVLLMIPFVLGLIIFAFLIRPLHRRTMSDVINGTARIRWGRFFFAGGIWAALLAAYMIIDYAIDPGNFQFRFSAGPFFTLVLISILLVPLQTTFEEVIFRGYLAQGVGVWSRSRWLVMIIPGVLFGLMHAANPEVAEFGFWISMANYIFFGLVFGLVCVLDDGIEATMGAHAANNIFASVFLTYKSSALQPLPCFIRSGWIPSRSLLCSS
jgi:membrane protease YdiL (CAAX protease family)